MTLENLPAIARKTAANLHSSGRWEIMELLLERLASEIETQASELATLRRRVEEMTTALCDAHDQITQFKTEGYISCPSVGKIEAAVGKSAAPLPPGRNEG